MNYTSSAPTQAVQNGLSTVPKDLTQRPQWVCWRWQLRRGEQTKVPVNARTGHNASSTNPETWASFGEAVQHYHDNSDRLAGVGFVFGEDDPYAGVDLDDCVDPDTGEIAAWAQTIIDDFDTYAEISPSGTGVKLFLQGCLPGGDKRKGQIEMYDAERFFTVTGRQVPGTPDKVYARQMTLRRLYDATFGPVGAATPTAAPVPLPSPPESVSDEEIISKGLNERNGKFRHLFEDVPDPNRLSEDDRALIRKVVFYTGGDAARAERILRRSARVRAKWDDPRGQTTWIGDEIEDVIGTTDPDNVYSWPRIPDSRDSLKGPSGTGTNVPSLERSNLKNVLQVTTFGGIGEPPPAGFVVNKLFPAGFPSIMYGMGGEGKSWLALYLSLCVAVAREYWIGHAIKKPCPVLYLDFELDAQTQSRRAHRLARGMGLDKMPTNLVYLSALGHTTAEAFAKVYELCAQHETGLVGYG